MVEPLRFGQTILGHKETTTAAQLFTGPLLEDVARIVEHSDPAETVQKSAVFRNFPISRVSSNGAVGPIQFS